MTDWLIDEFDVDTPFTFNNMMMLQVAKTSGITRSSFCAIKRLVAAVQVISRFINFNPSISISA